VKLKTEVLRYLKEADGYLSGQELCERLGVSRTAVWKVIRQLTGEGYEIEAVRNRGYRLGGSDDVFQQTELQSVIRTKTVGQNLVFLEEVDSTNNRAKQLAEAGAPDGTLVIARQQSAGKGRRGKTWESPAAGGIWMSLLLRPAITPDRASMLTLVAALAVAEGIENTCGLSALIKWPNDLVLNKKKICGILTEMSAEIDCINHVVIGIGINVNIKELPDELKGVATSLYLETGKTFPRSLLTAAILQAWETCYELFLQTMDLSALLERYHQLLVNRDKEVRVLAPGGAYDGIARGVTATGELLVEKTDGTMTEVLSGEVSVRGIYDYA